MLLHLPQSREWTEGLAREAEHQTRIDAAFDRAEAFDRLGGSEQALEWLARAAALSGGLPPAYIAMRTRIARELASRDEAVERAGA